MSAKIVSADEAERALVEARIRADRINEANYAERVCEARRWVAQLHAAEAEEQKEAARTKHVRSDHDIHSAVNLWCTDREAAELKYGHISQWNTSAVTNMKDLFNYKVGFNDDISQWDVSNVTLYERDVLSGLCLQSTSRAVECR